MRRLPLLLLVLLSGCALRRNANFAVQRLSGLAPMSDCWTEGKNLRVCHWKPYGLEEDPKSVLFFLHYATGDEKSFARVGLANSFYRRYKKRGVRPPRVFSVSYGSHWLLSESPGQRQVVKLEEFLRKAAELDDDPTKRRYLWGVSMGGYNAAVAALSSSVNGARFDGAALSCPALQARNPFTLNVLAQKTRGLRDGLHLFTYRLGGARVWDVENPAVLAARQSEAPPLLIEANARDEFGFAPGARELARLLRENGKTVVYHELPGGHCLIDGAGVADFLIGLGK